MWSVKAPKLRADVAGLLDGDIPVAAAHGEIGNGRERGTFSTVGKPDTADKVTARLKRDDPALADRVVRGEVSPNAAARENDRMCRCHLAEWGCGGVGVKVAPEDLFLFSPPGNPRQPMLLMRP